MDGVTWSRARPILNFAIRETLLKEMKCYMLFWNPRNSVSDLSQLSFLAKQTSIKEILSPVDGR